MRHTLAVLGLGVILGGVFLAGCGPSEKEAMVMREEMRPDQIKAIWVTRMDYRTEQDVRTIIENSHSLGMNTVVFQVRGNGTVSYPSRIEPWAEQFDFRDPGFDPLRVALDEAHKRDMRLEAYVNIMPGWQGPEPPSIRNQLYFTHPEWFWYDKEGERQPLIHKAGNREKGWYVSLNPCLPEVREYLTGICRELATNYEIDALHLDYIRFPNEKVVRGEVVPDYPRDQRTLALYKAETGLTPESDQQEWIDWRAEQVTKLVRDIRSMLYEIRPQADLTAAVGHNPEHHKQRHFQDSWKWVEEDLLDVVYTMNYTKSPDLFRQGMQYWTEAPSDAVIVHGIGAWLVDGQDLMPLLDQAWQSDSNFCVFAYSSFYPTAEDSVLTTSSKMDQERRERRSAMQEFIRESAVAELE